MQTEMMTNGTNEELKNPYVLLERCSIEEINSYKPRRERNSGFENNSNSHQIDSSVLFPVSSGSPLFHPYVVLERLSPNVIENFLVKREE